MLWSRVVAGVSDIDSWDGPDLVLQTKLINELYSTAQPLISQSKACVELCIHRLKNEIEELEPKLTLKETDPFYKVCGELRELVGVVCSL